MVLREHPLGLERGEHGDLGRLRELPQLGRRVRVADALAHVEQGIPGREERPDRGLHIVRIRPAAPALHRRVGVLVGIVLAQLARDQQQHRPRPAGAELGVGPARVLGDEVGAVHLAHPLGDRPEGLRHVEVGVTSRAHPEALRDHQQRGGVLPRLGDGPVGHLDARRVEPGHHGADPDLLAVRHPGEGVGHRDREALLAHHEDRHAFLAERVVHRARRVAAHPGRALRLEDAGESVDRLDLHDRSFGLRMSATAAA